MVLPARRAFGIVCVCVFASIFGWAICGRDRRADGGASRWRYHRADEFYFIYLFYWDYSSILLGLQVPLRGQDGGHGPASGRHAGVQTPESRLPKVPTLQHVGRHCPNASLHVLVLCPELRTAEEIALVLLFSFSLRCSLCF